MKDSERDEVVHDDRERCEETQGRQSVKRVASPEFGVATASEDRRSRHQRRLTTSYAHYTGGCDYMATRGHNERTT